MRKRAAATGNVQRGLFYLEKGDVLGAFFFFFSPAAAAAITHFMFSSSKKKQEKTIWRERAREPHKSQARIFFFFFLVFFSGTLDFLRNYINSGVFKSVFHRQKGGKL